LHPDGDKSGCADCNKSMGAQAAATLPVLTLGSDQVNRLSK
jgi:hypothetical protein